MLAGNLNIIPQQGIKLQLAGREDRIEMAIDSNYQPLSLFIDFDETNISGDRRGKIFSVNINNFPISVVKDALPLTGVDLPESLLSQRLSGALSGNLAINLDTFAIDGNRIAIANPRFGTFTGEKITFNFQYANNLFVLRNGQFLQGASQYLFDARYAQTPEGPQYQARLEVIQGDIQNLLEGLQVFEISDLLRSDIFPKLANAKDLYKDATCPPRENCPLFSVGDPQASILDRLRRLAEIQQLLAIEMQKRQEAVGLPPLRELAGTFDGTLTVAGSATEGITANFDFLGKEWQWGEYTADRIIARGEFRDGVITLTPVRVESGETVFNFSGSLGGDTQSSQLRVVKVPLAQLKKIVKLPPAIDLDGMLNGTVTIAGTPENPEAIGELEIAGASINQTPIESFRGSFNYDNARLEFFVNSILAAGAEPAIVSGSFPYKLPFASVQPNNNRFSAKVNIEDRGLTLLNILTRNQIRWVDGKGRIELDISGIFEQEKGNIAQFQARGQGNIQNATIAAQVLPDAPLTEVNGKILFDFDRLNVQNFQGKFSGGEVSIAGSLPLTQTTPQENPLTVSLSDLALNLKGLYRGGVNGEIQISGSAIAPDLSGNLDLFNGQVLLSQGSENNTQANVNNQSEVAGGGIATLVKFKRLKLNLAKNVQVALPPILNFLATGSLNVNGTLARPLPEGTIRLVRGQVNLYVTSFRLDRGYKNIAQFSPDRGLDPFLDVRLITSVLETTRIPIESEFLPNEIRDNSNFDFGTIETIRVRAQVRGYASKLTENIQLSSVPPRSEREILALLGGGFVNTLGRGSTTLGLANLAGSAIFGGLQNILADTLGLSEFRLFPIALVDDEKKTRETLDIAAEVGFDLGDRFSFSTLQVLTRQEPTRFGVRYRINNNLIIRGSTNFNDDNRVIIEYEQRF